MASLAKTIVATGASSGLGFEAIKQLLAQTQPYKFILGARDTKTAQAAYDALNFNTATHSLAILPLELVDLKSVRAFSEKTLEQLGEEKLDYLFLNAGMIKPSSAPSSYGSKWGDTYVANHLSQHYLTHLLKAKLEESKSRVVIVSSGGIRGVKDPSTLEATLLAGASIPDMDLYSASKFVQLLSAHYWRRNLPSCSVLAVSPGMIPGTALARNIDFKIPANLPDAKSVEEGAGNLLRALFAEKSTWPEDEERVFLTSWGEWWEKDVYGLTLDRALQEKWCLGKEEIEREEGLKV